MRAESLSGHASPAAAEASFPCIYPSTPRPPGFPSPPAHAPRPSSWLPRHPPRDHSCSVSRPDLPRCTKPASASLCWPLPGRAVPPACSGSLLLPPHGLLWDPGPSPSLALRRARSFRHLHSSSRPVTLRPGAAHLLSPGLVAVWPPELSSETHTEGPMVLFATSPLFRAGKWDTGRCYTQSS